MARPSSLQPPKSPKQYALRLLGQREWSAAELRERLRQRGVPDESIVETLDFLQSHGLQSDERFVTSRARGLAARKGNRAVRHELEQKGIAPALISSQIAEFDDEAERAVHATRRFEGQAFDDKLKAKAWRFLASRGFASDAIKVALKRLAQEAPAPGPQDEA